MMALITSVCGRCLSGYDASEETAAVLTGLDQHLAGQPFLPEVRAASWRNTSRQHL